MPEQVLRVEIDDVSRGAVAGMGGGGGGMFGGGASTEQKAAASKQSRGWGMLMNTMPGPMASIASGFKAGGLIGGISAGIAAIIAIFKKSVIFTSYFNSFIQIMGAFVDVALAPFIPIFQIVLMLMMWWFKWFYDMWPKSFSTEGIWAFIDKTTKEIWDYVSPVFKAIWDYVSPYFKAIWDYVSPYLKAIWDYVSPYFKAIWDYVSPYFKAIWDYVSPYFKAIWDYVSPYFKSIWDYVSPYFKPIWDYVSPVFKSIWDYVTPILPQWLKGLLGIKEPVFKLPEIPSIKPPGYIGGLFQHGTPYVPEDMLALLHKGEMVTPASQNIFHFNNNFEYSSPSSYLAGMDSLAGFSGNLQQTIRRIGL